MLGLEKTEQDSGENDMHLSYWSSSGSNHLDLMEGIGDFFSMTDVQECADDPSSIVPLDDISGTSDTTKSNLSIATDETNSYQDLDSVLTTPMTPSSSDNGSVTQCDWPAFIPLKTSAIQIQGNEIRHSPQQPKPVVSEESTQVQVPPLREPIIRRLEDTDQEKPKANRGRKSLDNLQKKPLKKKTEAKDVTESMFKAKGTKRQYRRGRKLENEFEEDTTSHQQVPTVTIHHHANHGVPGTAMQSGNQMKPHLSQMYQMYGESSISQQQPGRCHPGQFPNNSRGSLSSSFNANQRAQMNSETRNQLSEQTHQNGQRNGNVNNYQDSHQNGSVSSNGMFSRLLQPKGFHENSNRAYLFDGNSNSSATTASCLSRPHTPCKQRIFSNNTDRFDPSWTTSSLSPVEKLFRNRISEVNEVGERIGDVQKFIKNSQLYKQLLAPIKDENAKSCDKGNELEGGVRMADAKHNPQYNGGQPPNEGYDVPNTWTKVPTVAKPNVSNQLRSGDAKQNFEDFSYMDCGDNVRRDQFPSEGDYFKTSGNPYECVAEINNHFSKNDDTHNKNDCQDRLPSSKKTHIPDWLQPHTIGKDYDSMFAEILKLRFCVYSESTRSGILQAENLNLRRMMNIERNRSGSFPITVKKPVDETMNNNGGLDSYIRTEDMGHPLNSGMNGYRSNGVMNPKVFDQNGISGAFGQCNRENDVQQRSGHPQPQNMVYYNNPMNGRQSDFNVNVQQHLQRPATTFGLMNMMRR